MTGDNKAENDTSSGKEGLQQKLVSLVNALYRRLTAAQWLAPLLARLCVGYMFAKSGYNFLGKLDSHAAYFASLGVPAPELMAPFVVTLELVGGAMLMLGVGTRCMSIMLSGVMAVALMTEHFDKVKNDLSVLFYHSDFLLLLLLGWLVLAGPGKASLDHFLRRKLVPEADPS